LRINGTMEQWNRIILFYFNYYLCMTTLTESKKELVDQWRAQGVPENILQAFEDVPREAFVPKEMEKHAYMDQPLHIGHEQTISQPTTIINMLTLLDVSPKHKVLEIGSGSGYVCALLAALGSDVTGLEIIPELAVQASRTLERINVGTHVSIHAADGGGGWEQGAPYDRILISCAMPVVPRDILWQLKDGGILVAPVGVVEQRMIVLRKKGDEVIEEDHGAYVFVPMTGKLGDGSKDLRMPFV
jgi:protein-L-isoaspartate(D-aspartate) O-methyltransferase